MSKLDHLICACDAFGRGGIGFGASGAEKNQTVGVCLSPAHRIWVNRASLCPKTFDSIGLATNVAHGDRHEQLAAPGLAGPSV